MPEYEPRGCPRGASFSWYTYSPLRVKYPYVRGSLLELYREARERLGDPVDAWASIVEDPDKARAYKSQRGKGGFVRASWDEAVELIAAAHVHTIKRYGPDRVAGFSPIPAMSMASYAAGHPLPVADRRRRSSPSTTGTPTCRPPRRRSGATRPTCPSRPTGGTPATCIIWGTNLPTTRTPDAHFMTEARYRGQKVVVVSPDYAEHTKFADHWLPAQPGTDGALAHGDGPRDPEGVLRRPAGAVLPATTRAASPTCRCSSRCASATDALRARPLPARLRPRRRRGERRVEDGRLSTSAPASRPCPNGSVGHRYGDERRGPLEPRAGRDRAGADAARPRTASRSTVDLPRFDVGDDRGRQRRCAAACPPCGSAAQLVTTVFDLLLAQYGVGRDGLPGDWPAGYDDPAAVHAGLAGGDHRRSTGRCVARVAREFARNAERTRGPLDDRHGRRHQPLVPLRPDLPHVPHARACCAAARASTAAAGPTTSARRRCGR